MCELCSMPHTDKTFSQSQKYQVWIRAGSICNLKKLFPLLNQLMFVYSLWTMNNMGRSYSTVPLYGLDEGIVFILLQQDSLGVVVHEVQVLEGGAGLWPLRLGRLPLVRASLQVVLLVKFDRRWKKIVHDYESNVFTPTL